MSIIVPAWAGEIRAVGFDLDQTLYPDTPEIQRLVRQEIYHIIAEARSCSASKAQTLFETEYARLGRGTLAVQYLLGITDANDIMQGCLERAGVAEVLKYDQRLIDLFRRIKESNRQTFLVTGSSRKNSLSKLLRLGLTFETFDVSLCIDDPDTDKLHGHPFQQIIQRTGFQPREHVYAGDREKIDITPARLAGMRAVYVWGECANADISIPTIYDLETVLVLR